MMTIEEALLHCDTYADAGRTSFESALVVLAGAVRRQHAEIELLRKALEWQTLPGTVARRVHAADEFATLKARYWIKDEDVTESMVVAARRALLSELLRGIPA